MKLSDTNYMGYTTPEQRKTLEAGDKLGFDFLIEPEEESYEDVYGEPPPDGAGEYYWVAIEDADGEPLASCGMIDDSDMRYFWEMISFMCAVEALVEHAWKNRPGVSGMACDGTVHERQLALPW